MALALNSTMPIVDFQTAIIEEMDKTDLELTQTGFGTWSHSKLKTFTSCPLLFLLKNVLKIEYTLTAQEIAEQDSLLMKYTGLIAQSILEDMVNGMDFRPALDKIRPKYQNEISEESWDSIELLEERLLYFMDKFTFFTTVHGSTHHHTEQKLAFDDQMNPVDFHDKSAFFRGILDLSIFLKNGDVILFDHKNGGSAEFGLGNYESQLKSQAMLLACHSPNLQAVVPFIHFIQEGSVAGGNIRYSRERIMDEFFLSLKSRIDGSLENLLTRGKFRQLSGNGCQYCEFRAGCKSGKRGSGGVFQPIIEHSKKFFQGKEIL